MEIVKIGIASGFGLSCLFSLMGWSIYQLFKIAKS